MRKLLLVKLLHKKNPDIPLKTVSEMTDKIFDMIGDSIIDGHKVEIRHFGTFYSTQLGRRLLRNPVTGNMMEVAARRIPRFKANRLLRQKTNRHH